MILHSDKVVISQVWFCLFLFVFGKVDSKQFKPCNNDIFVMDDVRYPQKYWIGSIQLQKLPSWTVIQIQLQLSSPVTVTLKEPNGLIQSIDNRNFLFNYQIYSGLKRIRFIVQGANDFPFPNVYQVVVNGNDVCSLPQEFVPEVTRKTTKKPPAKPPAKPPTKPLPKPPAKPTVKPPPKSEAIVQRISTPKPSAPIRKNTPACGSKLVKHQGLITNGYPSREGDWPWHTALYHLENTRSVQYKCGGTLIARNVVLTAAHCVVENGQSLPPSRVIVKLGQYNRLIASKYTQELRVFQIITHDLFNIENLHNDIAILKLATLATLTNYVQPACLWPSNKVPLQNVVNKNGLVIGWGLDEKDSLTDILTQGTMPVIAPKACLQSNPSFFGSLLTDKGFCAGFRNGTSVCNGDSGGGMFFEMGQTWHIRGIVSLSVARGDQNVCNPKQYVLFTDTAMFLSWINMHMRAK